MVLNTAVIVSLVSLFSPFILPSPVNDDGVSFSFARDQYQRRLFQLSLSIPSLEGRGGEKKMFGSNGGLWNAVMWLHVHMLCVYVLMSVYVRAVCVQCYRAARCVCHPLWIQLRIPSR